MLWAKMPCITNLSSSPYFSFGYATKVAPPAYPYSHFAVFYQKLMCKPFFIILLFHSRVKFFLVLLVTLFTFIQCVFSIFRIFYLLLLLFSVTPVLLSVPVTSPVALSIRSLLASVSPVTPSLIASPVSSIESFAFSAASLIFSPVVP